MVEDEKGMLSTVSTGMWSSFFRMDYKGARGSRVGEQVDLILREKNRRWRYEVSDTKFAGGSPSYSQSAYS